MQVVAVRKSITVPVEKGHNTITLRAGVRYVMHDTEVDSGVAAGVWKRVEPLPEAPAKFNPRQTCTGQLLVPFIGGLGEAISMLPILASIRQQHPQLTIDVTTTPVNGAPRDTTAASLGTTTRCGHKRSLRRCWSVYAQQRAASPTPLVAAK